jgi:hypothetical protein
MLNRIPRGGRKIAAEKRTIDKIAGNATSRILMLLVVFINARFITVNKVFYGFRVMAPESRKSNI